MRALVRLAAGTAVAVAAVFLVVNAGPMVKDEVVRRETVRRVKNKVGEAVEGAMETVQDVQSRAEEAKKKVRTAAENAADVGKRKAAEAASRLETPAVREAREAAERAASKPWWRFWQRA